MKAKWIAAGVGVLIVAGITPWGVGYVTEQQWGQMTHELNQSQSFVQLRTDDYQRGFFGARVTGTVTMMNPENGESYPVEYQASVTHGITGSYMDFEPVSGWAPEDADWFHEQPRLTLESRLWGTAVLELEAPAIAINNSTSGESLRTSGGIVRVEVSDAGEQVKALAVWPQLRFTAPEMTLRADDFRLEQNMAHLQGDVWTGLMEASLATVALTAPGMPPVTIEGLQMRSSTEAKASGQRLDSRLSAAAEKLRYEDEGYGPHKLVFALENLDVASWGRLTTSMAELQALALTQDQGGREAFEQQIAAMEQVSRAARDLAAAGFTAGFPELVLNTPEGKVTGSAGISHPELTDDQKAEMLMVMQRLTGKMDLSLPARLVEKYPMVRMQLAPLIKQGLLVPEGDRLVLAARLSDMMVDVNGQEVPVPPLF